MVLEDRGLYAQQPPHLVYLSRIMRILCIILSQQMSLPSESIIFNEKKESKEWCEGYHIGPQVTE